MSVPLNPTVISAAIAAIAAVTSAVVSALSSRSSLAQLERIVKISESAVLSPTETALLRRARRRLAAKALIADPWWMRGGFAIGVAFSTYCLLLWPIAQAVPSLLHVKADYWPGGWGVLQSVTVSLASGLGVLLGAGLLVGLIFYRRSYRRQMLRSATTEVGRVGGRG